VPVAIIEATLRDLTFIAANMRRRDREEIMCQLPEGTSTAEVAAYAMQANPHVATLDGQPVAAFGAVGRTVSVLEAWAWGTDRMPRAVPAITRYVARVLMPQWLDAGVRRLEARSIATHTAAHRWMTSTGAALECAMPDYGRDGEGFYLFAWTVSGLDRRLDRYMKGKQ
jgi:hypothetical protein